MTDSSLNLSARADLDWLAELIGDGKQAAPSVEWLVVDALARDLHHSRSVRKQLNNVLAAEVDPAGSRMLIGQSGARDAEGFRLQVEAFQHGLMEGTIPP